MRCVKTGLKFKVPQFREDTFHGDMFCSYELGIYLIRGIAPGTSDCAADITFVPYDDAYAIGSVDPGFAKKFSSMNNHDIQLGILNGTNACVIIDDLRFFQ